MNSLINFNFYFRAKKPFLSRKEARFASCESSAIVLYNSTLEKVNFLSGHAEYIHTVLHFPKTKTLISASGHDLYLWDLNYHSFIQNLCKNAVYTVLCLAKLSNNYFLSGGPNQQIILWDVRAACPIQSLQPAPNYNSPWIQSSWVSALACHDGYIYAGATPGEMTLWGSEYKFIKNYKEIYSVLNILVDRIHKTLIISRSTSPYIQIFDISQNVEDIQQQVLASTKVCVFARCLSLTLNNYLLTGTDSGEVIFWDITTLDILARLMVDTDWVKFLIHITPQLFLCGGPSGSIFSLYFPLLERGVNVRRILHGDTKWEFIPLLKEDDGASFLHAQK